MISLFDADFVVEILLGCVSQDVRERASIQLFRLSQAQNQSSKHSLTQVKSKRSFRYCLEHEIIPLISLNSESL